MRPIFYLLIVILLQSCSTLHLDKIIVTGIALNAKEGAVVIDNLNQAYYIDGLDNWQKEYYNKKITVRGYLKKVVHKPQSTPHFQVQEISGWNGALQIDS